MRVTASIQARMGSTRLPGKVLKKICGKPMLLWQIERIRGCKLVDNIVVATSISKSDNIIEKFCNEQNIKLTTRRKEILSSLLNSDKALSVYDLIKN